MPPFDIVKFANFQNSDGLTSCQSLAPALAQVRGSRLGNIGLLQRATWKRVPPSTQRGERSEPGEPGGLCFERQAPCGPLRPLRPRQPEQCRGQESLCSFT